MSGVITGGTVPALHVDALSEVYIRSAQTYLKRRNTVLHISQTVNGEITYQWQQNRRKTTKYAEMQ
jgi:hypothetical protein